MKVPAWYSEKSTFTCWSEDKCGIPLCWRQYFFALGNYLSPSPQSSKDILILAAQDLQHPSLSRNSPVIPRFLLDIMDVAASRSRVCRVPAADPSCLVLYFPGY